MEQYHAELRILNSKHNAEKEAFWQRWKKIFDEKLPVEKVEPEPVYRPRYYGNGYKSLR